MAHSTPLAAHLGRNKTLEKLQRDFYWPGMTTDVRKMVDTCIECQRSNKDHRGLAPLVSTPTITKPFQCVAFDIVGKLPLTKRGNIFALTIMDMGTRFPEAIPLKKVNAPALWEAMEHFFCFVGFPKQILTDRGRSFARP